MDPPLDMLRNGSRCQLGCQTLGMRPKVKGRGRWLDYTVVAGSRERREEVVERPNPQTFMSSLGSEQHAQGAPPHWARLGPRILIV